MTERATFWSFCVFLFWNVLCGIVIFTTLVPSIPDFPSAYDYHFGSPTYLRSRKHLGVGLAERNFVHLFLSQIVVRHCLNKRFAQQHSFGTDRS